MFIYLIVLFIPGREGIICGTLFFLMNRGGSKYIAVEWIDDSMLHLFSSGFHFPGTFLAEKKLEPTLAWGK